MTDPKLELKSLTQEIAFLEQEVAKVLAPPPSETKRVPLLVARTLSWLTWDYSQKESTWVNGAEDFYVTDVTYAAVRSAVPDVPVVENGEVLNVPDDAYSESMCDLPMGLGVTNDEDANYAFDFVWNYRLGSTAAQYASSANNAPLMVDRKALGNRERNQFLNFGRHPLLIKAGDSITFSLQPLHYALNGTAENDLVFNVHMILIGWRDGKMFGGR